MPRPGIVLRRGFDAELAGWLAVAEQPASPDVAGGRGATRAVALAGGGRAFVRRYVHGGVLAGLLGDLYWQRPHRPWRELLVTEAARGAGVVAPEVLAAAVLPAPGRARPGLLYRGVLVTRALEGRRALGDVLREAAGAGERAAWLGCAVRAIRRLHAAGIHHPDLNVANVLLGGDADEAALIDFDRATVRAAPLGRLRVALACRRLSRSIAKLGLPGLDRAGAAAALRAAGLGTPQ
jgi:3-deoxy-D-manno-octulosonic acid kinase